MKTPHASRDCPQCGSPIPPAAPEGLCPRCVLGAAATPPPTRPGSDPRLGPPALERVQAAFPHLEIHECIGAGGMGVVFKARQKHLDRWVALKVLPESLAADPHFVERFHREARLLARLNHPQIVTVHDFGQSDGLCYLLMEYVDGLNLRDAMRSGRFTPEAALALVPRLCEALQFAHDEGILHRDIKPENILLDARGRVKIADFGIAKMLGQTGQDITLTACGAAVGTPQYMAPEQIEHPEAVDHRADIYSLGVVFYEMLTGELPIGRFAAPSQKVELDQRVDEIVLRALAKERELRQQSAAQVGTEVEGVRAAPAATAPSPVTPTVPSPRPAVPPTPQPDFLLCHPALPRLAQALTVYALLVAPALAILSIITSSNEPVHGPYAGFVNHLLTGLGALATLLTTSLLVSGGWRLRQLAPSAPRRLRLALWLNLGFAALLLPGHVWREHLSESWRLASKGLPDPTSPMSVPEAVLGLVYLAAFIFEITALVWLTRQRHALATLLAQAAPHSADAADEVDASAPVPGTIPHASLAAGLTSLSLVTGLSLIAALGLHLTLEGQPSFGLSPLEVGLGGLALATIAIPGAAGLLLGWRGARTAREAHARIQGVGRITWAWLAWPLAMLGFLVVAAVALALAAMEAVALVIALLSVLALGASLSLALRRHWHWLRAQPRGARVGRVPGWNHLLCAGLSAAVLFTLLPAAQTLLHHRLRDALPEIVTRVSPDPTVAQGRAEQTTAVELGIEYSPRAITWFRTSLLRDGQPVASPLSTFHAVNGSLTPGSGSLLVRTLATTSPDGEPAHAWELVLRAGTVPVTFQSTNSPAAGVSWQPMSPPQAVEFAVGTDPDRNPLEILRGRDVTGTLWSILLVVTLDPLPPSFLFEGVELAEGQDWGATASRRNAPYLSDLMPTAAGVPGEATNPPPASGQPTHGRIQP